jgi:hypothetical protein
VYRKDEIERSRVGSNMLKERKCICTPSDIPALLWEIPETSHCDKTIKLGQLHKLSICKENVQIVGLTLIVIYDMPILGKGY